MGAGNAKKAYAYWGDLPDGPLRLLVFMSLTALDGDDPPTFHRGREALAVGMGRTVADRQTTDSAEVAERRRAFKAVDRMICALKDAGAITQLRPAGPGHAAVYALNLSRNRTPITGDLFDETHPADRGPKGADVDQECTPVSGTDGPRSAGQRTPVSGATHPGHRGPKEERSLRTVLEEGKIGLSTASHPPREPSPGAPVVALFPGTANAPDEKPYRVLSPWRSRRDAAADTIAEARTNRAAARDAHQARLASGETT
jgi:hypothetical protein